jgi:cbb3-type cytochrome c oxidase subunit III
MKHAHLLIAFLAGALVTGCANPTRSRDLGNPKISAVTLAQQVCSNCHGVAGIAVSPNFPNLAAQKPAYVVAQLQGFKSHGRQDPAGFEYMWGLSRSLTDEQINGLAAYYAAQPAAHQPAESDAARTEAGRRIFHDGVPAKDVPACMTCHGDKGQGNEAFPRLAGQHADYVAKQLIVFQRTDQRPEGAIMKTIAHELSSEDIKDIAAYVQSLGS